MRKPCLLLILVLNITALAASAYVCYRHFFCVNNPVCENKTNFPVISEEKDIEENKPALVNIASVPEKAKVFVNGYYKGKTPVEFKVMEIENTAVVKLVLIKQNYLRWETQVTLSWGDFKEYNIVLEEEKNETD